MFSNRSSPVITMIERKGQQRNYIVPSDLKQELWNQFDKKITWIFDKKSPIFSQSCNSKHRPMCILSSLFNSEKMVCNWSEILLNEPSRNTTNVTVVKAIRIRK